MKFFKKINKKYFLLILPLVLLISCIPLKANQFPIANNLDELKQFLAESIRKDEYNFAIEYKSKDMPFLTEDGLDQFFNEVSKLAGPYYEHQLRQSGISVGNFGSTTVLRFRMNYEDIDHIDEINAYVKKEADKILAITKNPAEVIKKINDNLKANVTYSTSSEHAYSAYGVVGEKSASNMGYTMIMEKFFKYLNYESSVIFGMINGKANYWNIVKIGSNWYHVDVASNDQTSSDMYLLKSDSTMSSSRSWDYSKYNSAKSDYDFSAPIIPSEPESILPAGLNENVYKALDMGLLNNKLISSDLKKEMTREEFVEVILAVYESFSDYNPVITKVFEDTSNSRILKAYSLGLINGMSETRFAPDSYLTREQACVILYKLIKSLNGPTYYENISITDIKEVSSWSLEAMNYMVYNKIVAGVGGGRVNPKGTLIREHAIILAVRVKDILSN